ncbi:MAG: OmpA family protein [Gemmatimonadetes bacterium]|nr:OmpA family protein [Gemmatimonadota bacterium]
MRGTIVSNPMNWLAVTLVACVPVFWGCAHVSADDLDLELARVREELRQEFRGADRQVAEDLGTRMSRLESRLESVANDLERLRGDFAVTVERLEAAVRFHVPVYFAFDDATIREDDRPVLDRFAAVVGEHYSDLTITAEGFADPAGTAEYNLDLGNRRAAAVVGYLASRPGVDPSRLRAVSYGEDPTRLLDPTAWGPGERALMNRRVVLVIEGASERATVAENGPDAP